MGEYHHPDCARAVSIIFATFPQYLWTLTNHILSEAQMGEVEMQKFCLTWKDFDTIFNKEFNQVTQSIFERQKVNKAKCQKEKVIKTKIPKMIS